MMCPVCGSTSIVEGRINGVEGTPKNPVFYVIHEMYCSNCGNMWSTELQDVANASARDAALERAIQNLNMKQDDK